MIVCSSGIATTVHDDLGTYVRTVTVPPNGFQKSFSGASRWWMRLTISKILLLDIDSSSQKIFQTLKRRGEKVVIVCSSGIATTIHDDLGTYVRTVTVPPNGFQKSFSGASRWWMRLTISKILLLDIDSSSQIMLEATFTLFSNQAVR